jgi:branched-chain amino acid transport system ATP-binding protein
LASNTETGAGQPLLELCQVSVNYGAFRALTGVSYLIYEGQMVSLLGGNASGKSTSIKAVFGVVRPTSGRIYFEGQDITSWPTEKRVRAGLAIVPEGRRLFANMSIEENLGIGTVGRRDTSAIKDDLDKVYQMFPRLVERRKQLAGTLSGGEQQMAALGRALMARPKLICMDEPSMGLAPAMVRRSFDLIKLVRDNGTSVFVVEQNANVALRIADYAYVLRAGDLVLEGSAEHVAGSEEMKEAYLGPAQGHATPP